MYKPDLVSEDRATSRLLVVEVKQTIADRDREFFMQQLRQYADSLGAPRTVYFVLVDQDWIRFYEASHPEPLPLLKLATRETLRTYTGTELTGPMSEFLMSAMTMAWLRDLALHWKEKNPPGSAEISPDIVDLITKGGIHVESVS